MRFSWWTQHWQHQATVPVPRQDVFHALREHYQSSSKSFSLLNEDSTSSLEFSRGYKAMSIVGIGSERLLKHHVVVRLTDSENQHTSISWSIELKLFGFQVASNAIIEECKQLTSSLAEQDDGQISSESALSDELSS